MKTCSREKRNPSVARRISNPRARETETVRSLVHRARQTSRIVLHLSMQPFFKHKVAWLRRTPNINLTQIINLKTLLVNKLKTPKNSVYVLILAIVISHSYFNKAKWTLEMNACINHWNIVSVPEMVISHQIILSRQCPQFCPWVYETTSSVYSRMQWPWLMAAM